MPKVLCANKHRMVPITSNLMLCECASYGLAADLKGAVEEARALVEKAGGIASIRDRIELEEEKRQIEARERRKEAAALVAGRIRKDV